MCKSTLALCARSAKRGLTSRRSRPRRHASLSDVTCSCSGRVRTSVRGAPWSTMPRAAPPSLRGTAPRGAQRHGANGMKSCCCHQPMPVSSLTVRAASVMPDDPSYSERRFGMMTICGSSSACTQTPKRSIDNSSLSAESAKSCSRKSTLRWESNGGVVVSSSLGAPLPSARQPRRSQMRPRARGWNALLPKATVGGRGASRPATFAECHACTRRSAERTREMASGVSTSSSDAGCHPSVHGGCGAGGGRPSVCGTWHRWRNGVLGEVGACAEVGCLLAQPDVEFRSSGGGEKRSAQAVKVAASDGSPQLLAALRSSRCSSASAETAAFVPRLEAGASSRTRPSCGSLCRQRLPRCGGAGVSVVAAGPA